MTIALITNTDFTDFTDAAYKECLSQSTSVQSVFCKLRTQTYDYRFDNEHGFLG